MSQNDNSLLVVENLKKYFRTNAGILHAVDDVSFSIPRGKTLGVVGESGCGKSILGKTVLRLIEPTSGNVILDGVNIAKLSKSQLRKERRKMQMIFQDPYSSLDGHLTVAELIADPLKVNHICSSRAEMNDVVGEMMESVGLSPRFLDAYPH